MSSTTNQSYNGWSNRETWLANLWLCNDEQSYSFLLSFCKDSEAVAARADRLKSYMQYNMQDHVAKSGLFTDLLNTAFSKINWIEIIQAQAE